MSADEDGRGDDRAPLTFITIAQDEATNIERCIASTRGLGAAHVVVDGGSRDDTVRIARSSGASVITHPFDNHARQYTRGIIAAPTDWVFVLDADEAIDPELRQSLHQLRLSDNGPAAFAVRRRNRFVNRWAKHGAWYPDTNLRLLDRRRASYEDRPVHARVQVSGTVGLVQGHILHHTYASVSHYLRKLDAYTEAEVEARRDLATSERDEGKTRARSLWLRTPFRPLTRFLVDYVFRGGFRDGRLGFDIAVLAAFYEFVVGVKRRYPTPPVPTETLVERSGTAP